MDNRDSSAWLRFARLDGAAVDAVALIDDVAISMGDDAVSMNDDAISMGDDDVLILAASIDDFQLTVVAAWPAAVA